LRVEFLIYLFVFVIKPSWTVVVVLFVCMFVGIKPEKLYFASCWEGSKPHGSGHTRAEAQTATCIPKTEARQSEPTYEPTYLSIHVNTLSILFKKLVQFLTHFLPPFQIFVPFFAFSIYCPHFFVPFFLETKKDIFLLGKFFLLQIFFHIFASNVPMRLGVDFVTQFARKPG